MDVLQSASSRKPERRASHLAIPSVPSNESSMGSAPSATPSSGRSSHRTSNASQYSFIFHPLRCKPPGPAPMGAGPGPPRVGFWRRQGQGFLHHRNAITRHYRDSSPKFKTPFLFRRFVGGELLILELEDHDNWRFISDAEWWVSQRHRGRGRVCAAFLGLVQIGDGLAKYVDLCLS